MSEKYMTHKNILEYFNNHPDIKYIPVYISFVGDYPTQGYKSTGQKFEIITPTKIFLERQKDEMVDCFGNADKILNEIDSTMFPKFKSKGNPVYPSSDGNVTHFDWNVRCVDCDKNPLDYSDDKMHKIKFYPNKKMSDLNFVRMLRAYLEQSELLHALSTYDSILDKYSDVDPSDLMKHL